MPQGPLRLWVDITSRCNLRCTACPQRLLPEDDRRDMDDALLASLVRQAKHIGCEVNLFHRGEPLLYPGLPLWIKRFRQNARLVRIHTNATMLDKDRVAGLLWAAPNLLTCSIDSLDPAEYAAARKGADLGRTLAGLERLLRARRTLGKSRPVITLLTMGEAPPDARQQAAINRLKALGLDRAVHRRPHNWGGDMGQARQTRPNVCTFPWYGLAVLSGGVVTPCPQDFFGKLGLGDAGKQGLMEIWNGEKAKALRRAHATGDLGGFELCQTCDRIRRPTILGAPVEHLKNFVAESIVGKFRL